MRFFYRGAILPNDDKLLMEINTAAFRLCEKLYGMNINTLDISDYNKAYLENHLRNIIGTLQKYSYLLSWSLAYSKLPLNNFIFVDYGAGSGILSLLAKELGIGTVVYNDIYDVSCRDSKIIGQAIRTEVDYYVEGDIDNLINFLKMHSIPCNGIASYDVIEHIYDIDDFLVKISSLSDTCFSIVMASGANPYNPIIKKKIMQQHLAIEYKDREKKWGHKERDCLKAYFSVRRKIISDYAHSLSNAEVDHLAKTTRGLIEPEIRECVEEYLRTGESPQEPDHPTNTCDPFTGNWAERLMDTNHLRKILLDRGFKAEIKPGYYGRASNNTTKVLIGNLLNPLISLLKDKGLILAPFYTIYARKCEFSA